MKRIVLLVAIAAFSLSVKSDDVSDHSPVLLKFNLFHLYPKFLAKVTEDDGFLVPEFRLYKDCCGC